MNFSNRYFSLLIVIATCSVLSCISNFDLEINQEPYLVIDGLITNKNEPYKVSIYEFDGSNQKRHDVVGANVVIRSDEGEVEHLLEQKPGRYVSSDNGIKGEIGRSYILEVTLSNGKTYISESEELKPNVGLESIRWKEDVFEYVSNFGNNIKLPIINVFVDSKSIGQNDKQYRWRYTDIYEFTTNPELNVETDPRTNETTPAPLPCSGYIVDINGALVQVRPCECCLCYITEYSDEALVSESEFTTESFKDIKVASVFIDERFTTKFYIEVEQLSLTDRAYEFWSLVSKQINDRSSIFASTPANISSNIRSKDNPNDIVFGYFGASAVSSISLFIERGQLINDVPAGTSTADCRLRENSTNQEPDFW